MILTKITILGEKDHIGFQNMVLDDIYYFDVECVSEIGDLFQLDNSVKCNYNKAFTSDAQC